MAHPQPCRPQGERGIALVLTMIFSILLYIIVAELVVSGRMLRLTGENDALLARMRNHMDYTVGEIEETLLSDLAGAAAGAEGGGGSGGGLAGLMGGAAGAPAGGAPGAGGEGEEEPDPAATCDSSRDAWSQPQSRAENDLTTYFWVEAENAKFNLLSLWSPDPKWAEFSRDQLVRLLDALREDTEFDLASSDAMRIVSELDEWVRRRGIDALPRPPLKSDDPRFQDHTIPLHLDELMMLQSVDEDLFFDKVLDGKVIPGLESALTIWTALQLDPGDPEKQARNAARGGNQPAGDRNAPGGQQPGAAAPPTQPDPNDPNAPPAQPIGEGIRININLAPRAVLRALMPENKMPDAVIDAIIRWRNEDDPELLAEEQQGGTGTDPYDFGNLELGGSSKKRIFATVEDLEQLPEFASLADPEVKSDFMAFCTTKSDVFSVHLATMFRRNDENRIYVLRRARTIVMRQDDGGDGTLYPLIRFEERHGLRVVCPDLQDQAVDYTATYSMMDEFAQEDRAWNPFLVDFYLPKWQRDQFLQSR